VLLYFANSLAKERKTWSIIIPVRPSGEVVLATVCAGVWLANEHARAGVWIFQMNIKKVTHLWL